MRNVCSIATPPACVGNTGVRVLWEVAADASYNVEWAWPTDPAVHVVVRTVAGRGDLETRDGQRFELTPESLLVLPQPSILHYFCAAREWRFCGRYEMQTRDASWFETGRVIPAPVQPTEDADLRRAFRRLRDRDEATRRSATGILLALLTQWLSGPFPLEAAVAATTGIGRVLDAMHEKLHAGWTVRDMARLAHLGERGFRKAFEREVGVPPKAYFDQLRLQAGRELLRGGGLNVSETADRLGYSSPFHFSRAFRRHYGFPPSHTPGPQPRTTAR